MLLNFEPPSLYLSSGNLWSQFALLVKDALRRHCAKNPETRADGPSVGWIKPVIFRHNQWFEQFLKAVKGLLRNASIINVAIYI